MHHKSRAIVLRRYETGETSEAVHAFTEEHGPVSIYGRGLRSPRNRLAPILQPLHLIELEWVQKDGADMGTLRDASPIDDFPALCSDLERLSLSLILAETAAGFAAPGQPAEIPFAALLDGLAALHPDAAPRPVSAAVHAMATLLHVAGYYPALHPDLLRPWPKDKPRPELFRLHLSDGIIHLDGPQPRGEAAWPKIPPADALQFPLPPQAVRFLHELELGHEARTTLSRPHAIQLLEALIRFTEWQHEAPLKSAAFWRSLE